MLFQRNAVCQIAFLRLILLVRHFQYLHAENDTLNHVDDADDAKGHATQNDAQNASLYMALHKAGHAVGIEDDTHNAKYDFIAHLNNLLAFMYSIIQRIMTYVNEKSYIFFKSSCTKPATPFSLSGSCSIFSANSSKVTNW